MMRGNTHTVFLSGLAVVQSMALLRIMKPLSVSRMKPCCSSNPTPWWTLPSHPLQRSPGSQRLGSGKAMQTWQPLPLTPALPAGLLLWPGSPPPAGTGWQPSPWTIPPDPTRTTLSSLLAQKLAWYLKFWQRPVLSLWMTAYYWKRLKHTTMQSRYILREHSSALLKNFRTLFHLVISFQPSKLAVVWHISVLGFVVFFFSLTEINPGFVFFLSPLELGGGQLMSLKIIQPLYFTCGRWEHFSTTPPTL